MGTTPDDEQVIRAVMNRFDFSFTDKATLGVHLSVLATRAADGWLLSHYQVSYLA